MPPHRASKKPEQSEQPAKVFKPVQKYKEEEIDMAKLSSLVQTILQQKPFDWQLEIAVAVLRGEDVIVDVGTGSGKTMCFTLPTLLDEKETSLVISPLTVLMVDQVSYQLF